jgi:putative ABC transport system ATP-binding protein
MIRLEKLSKSYLDAGRERPVLCDVSAAFERGQSVALRGRSGSGKTTLLNLIAGIDEPTSGAIYIDGVRMDALTARQRTAFRREAIGFVFQFFNLIPTLTVLENVTLQAELGGGEVGPARARGRELLDQVGLAERGHEFPERLSGGEQQRVAIARALLHEPRLILADEPTGNLDEGTGATVLDLLFRLSSEHGRMLLLATHSHTIAERSDRVMVIEDCQLTPLWRD